MIDVAIKAAQEGGKIALSYFKNIPKVTYKLDNSPVTIADKKAEQAIRRIITSRFPDHGIIGEEFPALKPGAKYQWTIDPIDGTKSFVRGIPDWGVLIAVLEDNKPIIGIYNSPATGELFTCQTKKGTYLNCKKTYVSKVKSLTEAFIVHGALNHFDKYSLVGNVLDLTKIAQGKRGASDCDGLNMLLKGQVDINISASGSIWDYAAPAILTEEAGGKFTDFGGNYSITNNTAIFSNSLIHKEVQNILNKR